jgi:hypothetical protein
MPFWPGTACSGWWSHSAASMARDGEALRLIVPPVLRHLQRVDDLRRAGDQVGAAMGVSSSEEMITRSAVSVIGA